jgi:hypothetical protein
LDSKSITTYIVKRVLSVVNESKNINISIFPNPVENYLKLSTVENINVLNVCNLFGQNLITINNPQVQTINIIGL